MASNVWRPTMERFNERYEVNSETGCWEWIRGIIGTGYGAFRFNKKVCQAHRVSYQLFIGDINQFNV